MKKVAKVFGLLIVTPILLSLLVSVFGGFGTENVGEVTNIDKIKSRGRTYTILEIVPHEARTHLSYMVKGSEPISPTQMVSVSALYGRTLAGYESLYGKYNVGYDGNGNEQIYSMTNVFTRSVFGTNDLDIKVIVMTPAELNTNLDIIDEADLIYITPDTTGYSDDIIKHYLKDYKELNDVTDAMTSQIKNMNFDSPGCDLSWDAVKKLYEFAVEDKYPLMMNGTTYMNNANKNGQKATSNFAKLYILLTQLKDYKVSIEKVNEYRGKLNWETGTFNGNSVWNMNDIAEKTNKIKDYYYFPNGRVDTSYWAIFGGNIWIYDNNNIMGNAITNLGTRTTTIYGGEDNTVPEDSGMLYVDIVRYIINHSSIREPQMQRSLTILEIEPSKSFMVKKTLKDNGFKDKPNFNDTVFKEDNPAIEIRVIERTSQGFNTVNEDLISTYDVIVMGLDTGNMNVDGSGKTKYNDTLLNGKVYLHLGDIVRVRADTVHLTSDYTTNITYKNTDTQSGYTRYSGNDISMIKQKELQDYINAGLNIITDINMLKNDVANADILDNRTNIYDLINNNIASLITYDNPLSLVTRIKKIGTEFNIAPSLNITLMPPNYSVFNNYIEVPANEEGDHQVTLTYRFNIEDTENSRRYDYCLLFDTDGDGKFDDKDSEGAMNAASRSNISKGSYTIEYELPMNYTGLISWKLEITKDNGLKDYITGDCAVLGKTEEIKILHIKPATNNTLTIENDFINLLNPCKGYTFICDEVTNKEFENWYTPSAGGTRYNSDNRETDKLFGYYDIIILGFGDMYGSQDISNVNGALDNIYSFIEAERSVLFVHDTTTFIRQPGWSYNLTEKFKDVLGMNRFRVGGLDRVTEDDYRYKLNAGTTRTITPKALSGYTDGHLIGRPSTNASDANQLTPFKTTYTSELYKVREVSKANGGVVSKYPYNIDPSNSTINSDFASNGNLKVAETHSQYFALDYEEEDLTVWYTLAGSLYDESPLDGRNNYYIYTNGSITYTGAGHVSSFTQGEKMLLVNTIIAAVSNANHVPYIDLADVIVTSVPTDVPDQYTKRYYKYISEVDNSLSFKLRAVDKDFKDTHFSDVKVYVDVDRNGEFSVEDDYLFTHYNESTGGKLQNNMWTRINLDNIDSNWFNVKEVDEDGNEITVASNNFNIIVEVVDARYEDDRFGVSETITVQQRSLFDLK